MQGKKQVASKTQKNQGALQAEPSQRRTDMVIQMGQGHLDLSGFPEETRNELYQQYAEGTLENVKKDQSLKVENSSAAEKMNNMTGTVAAATNNGASVTMTTTIEDSMGRTEIMMGNTDAAARGKMSRSQKGEKDMTLTLVVIGAVAVVLIALIASMGA